MEKLIEQAGIFIWPLGLCSLLAVFILIERLIALRPSRIAPPKLMEALLSGDALRLEGDEVSVVGRILYYFNRNRPDPEALKAFATLEIARMERGLFILDSVVGAAPLIGLLGTVTGLYQTFSTMPQSDAALNPAAFGPGIAMALTTTMLGLAVAIPALIGNAYLNRRIDIFSARIGVGVERLIELSLAEQQQHQVYSEPTE